MGDDLWCKTCRGYKYASGHTCPQAWRIWSADQDEDEARTVYAHSVDSAVNEWAAQDDNDSAEYSIANGNEATVCVLPAEAPAGTKPRRFEVTGEYEPNYHATELDAPEEETDAAG